MKKICMLGLAAGIVLALISGSCKTEHRAEHRVLVGEVNSFLQNLQSDGFTVQEGQMQMIDLISLFCRGLTQSAYGNNSNPKITPYLAYALPKPADELSVDPAPWRFRLRQDEALVFVGRTPPRMKYFSFRSYIFSRVDELTGVNHKIFASLGDTINCATIKTEGTPDGDTGNAFGQNTMVITCADRGIEAWVRSAAVAAGYSSAIINYDVIPADMMRLGLDSNADNFVMAVRMAFFENESDWEAYINPVDPATRGRVFRLTPNDAAPSDPQTLKPLRVRGTGRTEMALNPQLKKLREAILAKYSGWRAQELETYTFLPEGMEAIQRKFNALGENRDAAYLRTSDFELADNEFIVAYGVNHALSNKATYCNLNVYSIAPIPGFPLEKEWAGIASINSEEHMPKSARAYLPGESDADKFYVCKISRLCNSEPGCLEIPASPCARVTNKLFCLVFRAYLEPKTRVGPYWGELLFDQAIKFSPL